MVRFTIGDFGQQRWAEIVAGIRDPSLLQTWEYGEARVQEGRWRIERGLLTDGDQVVGAAQVMIRELPVIGGGLAWLGRGPLWADGVAPDKILAALRRYYVEDRGLYLRLAPPVAEDDPAFVSCLEAGYRATDVAGWASSRLDLSASEDALRAGLKAKWRNSLSQAERLGVAVTIDGGTDAFDRFLAGYREFLISKGFSTTVTPELLAALHPLTPPEHTPAIYEAWLDGRSLGANLIVRYGQECEYLVGYTNDGSRRAVGVGQQLLWTAIRDMKVRGCRALDLGGMDAKRTPSGIYRFKNGVGGAPYQLAPEIEAVAGDVFSRLVRWRVSRARREGAAGAAA